MTTISYRYCYFPPDVIQHAVWLYWRFTSSFRDVEDMLAERGVEVAYETVRRWVARFGPQIARHLRRHRPVAHPQWHLDEMFVSIGGRRMYLWRAVDQDGEVLDVLVQARRDRCAATKPMRKLLEKRGFAPRTLVTDKSRAYAAAVREFGLTARHHRAKWKNNRIESATFRSDDENERCSISDHPALLNDFSPSMPPYTTRSTPAATRSPRTNIENAEMKRFAGGATL